MVEFYVEENLREERLDISWNLKTTCLKIWNFHEKFEYSELPVTIIP